MSPASSRIPGDSDARRSGISTKKVWVDNLRQHRCERLDSMVVASRHCDAGSLWSQQAFPGLQRIMSLTGTHGRGEMAIPLSSALAIRNARDVARRRGMTRR